MQRTQAPQAVQACHELAAWLIPQLEKFPRTHRFTLGERIKINPFALAIMVTGAWASCTTGAMFTILFR